LTPVPFVPPTTVVKTGGVAAGGAAVVKMVQTGMQAYRNTPWLTKAGSNPFTIATAIGVRFSGGTMVKRLLASYALEGVVGTVLHYMGQSASQHAWMQGHKYADQLPVTFTPLMFNGTPWTAGLESDDMLYTVPFYSAYYSWARFVTGYRDLMSSGIADVR
jgi:hypothetical protein